jgi:hypothetical protein
MMTLNAMSDERQPTVAPLDEEVDHVRGSSVGRLILEYGDYECPYSGQAFRAIQQVVRELGGNARFAFRHFPLTQLHPHALAAAAAAEAAARQGRFWPLHDLLLHRQKELGDAGLLRFAAQLGLDLAAFDQDRASAAVLERIRRDVDSGLATGQVLGPPILFIGRLGAPRRLRPGHLAGGAGHMNRTGWRPWQPTTPCTCTVYCQVVRRICLTATPRAILQGPALTRPDRVNPGALRTSTRTEVPARPGRLSALRASARTTDLGEGGGGDEPQRPGTTSSGID